METYKNPTTDFEYLPSNIFNIFQLIWRLAFLLKETRQPTVISSGSKHTFSTYFPTVNFKTFRCQHTYNELLRSSCEYSMWSECRNRSYLQKMKSLISTREGKFQKSDITTNYQLLIPIIELLRKSLWPVNKFFI